MSKNENISHRLKKTLKGKVVSDKMDKTIVVLIERIKEHPKYRKRYNVSKKYKVHDSENKYHIGDKITIQECKPISKGKKWIVVE
ncbi:MAG TPA: 30S ribosomal protein S17 [Candidatus Portnoybacteria bacterium]|jgi:small subunit ribosomal protein S17|nr:30S ribosomal protein S17 [Candidatus Portnoybacteria bacterium]MDD5751944.1 30S ribosomal protein S17 [Candidatus Portnoybacteria bacterium]HPJ80147.1 30S ribosomal protein S17 [Candidatus Portnoybacteria bacterium]